MIESIDSHVARRQAGTVGITVRTPTEALVSRRTSGNMKDHVFAEIRNIVFFNYI
jgi:hypothetical protein